MDLSPDLALIAALWLPFMVTVVALNVLLVRPFREFLDGRHQAIVGARRDAEKLVAAATADTTRLEGAISDARKRGAATRAEHRARGQGKERELLAEARGEAEVTLFAAIAEIQAESAAARGSLGEHARVLSVDIAARVLGRGVSA